MKVLYYCSFVFNFFCALSAFAQTPANGDYQTVATGSWSNIAIWQRYNGTLAQWEAASTAPSYTDGVITLKNNVSVPTGTITVDQITINPGILLTIDGTLNLNNGAGAEITTVSTKGAAGNITVFGTLVINEGTTMALAASTVFTVKSGGLYLHNYETSVGTIYPVTNWETGSTLKFAGYTSFSGDGPAGLNQNFYNVIWDCPNHTSGFVNLNLSGTSTSIANDFTVVNTAGAVLSLSDNNSFTLTIGGDFFIESAAQFYFNYNTTHTSTVTVTGDFDWGSTVNSAISDGGNTSLTVNGDFYVRDGSTLRLNGGDFGTGTVDIYLKGNMNVGTTATLTKLASGGITNILFDANTPAVEKNFFNAGSITNAVNFTIKNGAVVNLGNSALTGSGTFVLEAGGTMKVGSADGLVTGTGAGNIRVSGARSYVANGNIVYNSSAAQNLGNEWGSAALSGIAVNLEIANTSSSGVTNNVIGSTSLAGNLTLTSGTLNIGNSNTLVIQSNFSSAGGTIGGLSTSNLTISGAGTMTGNLNFAPDAQNLNNLTISRDVTITLGTPLTISGILSFTEAGELRFNGQALTINGDITQTGGGASGGLESNSTSNLTVGGTGALSSLPFVNLSQLNNMTLARTTGGTYTLASAVTIHGTLSLNAGTLTHSSGLTMATGSIFSRNAGASIIMNAPSTTGSYNVSYFGALTTGLELPSNATSLNNLTIAGDATLDKAITINGNVTLNSGTLNPSTFNITMAGLSNMWNKINGSFAGGSGAVIIAGNISVSASSTPSFSNLTTTNASVLTMYSGNTNISGNIQLNSGCTFDANGGTVILNGSSDQTISAAGKTFRNITVNKAGGNVTLSTTLSLSGLLDIQSLSTVASSGNLTLISNASGTASVAKLVGSVSGNVNVQRYIANAGRKYRDISSPVENAPVSDITASGITITGPFTGSSYPCAGCSTNNPSFYYYDESAAGAQTEGYLAYPTSGANSSTTFLNRGRGYNLLVRDELGSPTMSLTGPINSGSIALPVTYNTTIGGASEDGWNFVGNPYPSAIDWDILGGWSKGNVQGNSIYIYDPTKGTSGGYRIWNGSTGDLGSGHIASGQGFWVKFSGAPALTVTEDAKVTSGASFYRKKNSDPNYIEIVLTGSDSEDRAYIQQIKGSSFDFDSKDGAKFMSKDGLNLSILTTDNFRVAIQATGEIIDNATIPLMLNGIVPGNYKFNKNLFGAYEGVPIMLFDSQKNAYHDLTNEYSFDVTDVDSSISSERFFLIVGRSSLVTGTEEPLVNIVSVYPNPVSDFININVRSQEMPSGKVMDAIGHVIGDIQWSESTSDVWEGSFEMEQRPSGIYFARVKVKNHLKVLKFIRR